MASNGSIHAHQCPATGVHMLQLLFILLFSSPPRSFAATISPIGHLNNTNSPQISRLNYTDHVTISVGYARTTDNASVGNATDGWWVVPVLVLPNQGPSFACGLLCLNYNTSLTACDTILFGVFLVVVSSSSNIRTNVGPPVVVWTANRNSPVRHYAVLRFTATGDLRLEDSHGDLVWSTGASASNMSLTDAGNLVLYDRRNGVVWQSFDYPTNTALMGQSLSGKKLVANFSAVNSSEGHFLLDVHDTEYSAFVRVDSSPLQIYYSSFSNDGIENGVLLPMERANSRFDQAKKFVRLETDGQLRKYIWSSEELLWRDKGSSMKVDYRGVCAYPLVCHYYGNCTDGECSCPRTVERNESYFEQVEYLKSNEGCKQTTPLSCQPEQQHLHQLLDYGQIAFYGYAGPGNITGTDVENCKRACQMTCSCKGAFFKYWSNSSNGDCYLPSTILSFTENRWDESNYNSSAFLKVQISDNARTTDAPRRRRWTLELAIGVLCALILLGIFTAVIIGGKMHRRRHEEDAEVAEGEEIQFASLPGMPTRFTYEELRSATDNFSVKLGEGGFGAVFQGTLRDGMRIAVKLLGCRGQGMKEFLAEVESIGSIHHVNLVRLVGYCAERLHRILVYEFLSNGSLDKWIFHCEKHPPNRLDWATKYKIILDVARGLSYLHEDCRQRIIHLDIKPQNILLDERFNAKVSDFGLSKLVERDQSQVVTTMRGTPGYIAPEWLSSMITEKVDVYSFGVVVLEMVSGKRVLDNSRSRGSVNLLTLLKKVAEEDRLLDIVAAECNGEEAMKMVRIAVWCLQGDYTRRPSMSTVVNVLEGVIVVEKELDHNFWVPAVPMGSEVGPHSSGYTPLLPSLVSGPR